MLALKTKEQNRERVDSMVWMERSVLSFGSDVYTRRWIYFKQIFNIRAALTERRTNEDKLWQKFMSFALTSKIFFILCFFFSSLKKNQVLPKEFKLTP